MARPPWEGAARPSWAAHHGGALIPHPLIPSNHDNWQELSSRPQASHHRGPHGGVLGQQLSLHRCCMPPDCCCRGSLCGGTQRCPQKGTGGIPGQGWGRMLGLWGGQRWSTDPLRSSPASPDAGGSPRQRGGGVRGRTALGNIPSHLKGAINHSLFIKSPARPGEKCQEHKSPPPLACKGSWLAKGCKAGSEPPTVPREATARPRSASVPTDKGWGARVPITRPPLCKPCKRLEEKQREAGLAQSIPPASPGRGGGAAAGGEHPLLGKGAPSHPSPNTSPNTQPLLRARLKPSTCRPGDCPKGRESAPFCRRGREQGAGGARAALQQPARREPCSPRRLLLFQLDAWLNIAVLAL